MKVRLRTLIIREPKNLLLDLQALDDVYGYVNINEVLRVVKSHIIGLEVTEILATPAIVNAFVPEHLVNSAIDQKREELNRRILRAIPVVTEVESGDLLG
jgi:hypothetical protein